MTPHSLHLILTAKDLSQSDLASICNVSRQAVSLWFNAHKSAEINLSTRAIRGLIKLGVPPKVLTSDTDPDVKQINILDKQFVWDQLYPSIYSFAFALVKKEPRALARLTQVVGLFQAKKIVGKAAWKEFHEYKKFIIPVRREQCEKIWSIATREALI